MAYNDLRKERRSERVSQSSGANAGTTAERPEEAGVVIYHVTTYIKPCRPFRCKN